MSVRLEEVVAALDALRAQVVALAGVVDGLRSDSAEHEAMLGQHAQRLDHVAQDVEDAQGDAAGVLETVMTWAPTLACALPLFKALHWPDEASDGVRAAESANDPDGEADDRQPG